MTRGLLPLGVLASALLLAQAAHADDKAACLAATERGQRLRVEHKLIEARKEFLVCARPVCPSILQQTCSEWVTEVQKSLPTVVVTAKARGGADLVDVTVTVDGAPLVTKLDGEAVPMNPGRHTLHFATPARKTLDSTVLIKEGEKDQEVSVVLDADARASSTWRTAGWVLGGAGVVGLLAGTIAGIVAIGDNGSAHCDASGKGCLSGPLSDARGAAAASDVGFVAGGILLAGGAALVLLVPKGSDHAASASLSPSIGPGGAGVTLGGRF